MGGAPGGYGLGLLGVEKVWPQHDIHHVSWISLENDHQFGSGVALVRPRTAPQFTGEHVDTLRRLGPHLTQAFHIQRHFEHLQDKDTMLEKGVDRARVAVIGLVADGRVTSMSGAANAFLARRDPLRTEDGRIAGNEPDQDQKLRQMLRAAARPLLDANGAQASTLRLQCADGNTALHLEVTPWGSLLEALGQGTFVRRRLGFKGMEAEIALLLFDRCNQKEIARRLGISDVSVRQHLHVMYAKAGLDGQLGLVQLMVDFLLEEKTRKCVRCEFDYDWDTWPRQPWPADSPRPTSWYRKPGPTAGSPT